MRTILLYAPDVVGHPRVYCRVIADALRDADCHVVLAMGFRGTETLENSPDVAALVGRPGVLLVNTCIECGAPTGHLTAEQLGRLQATVQADTTVFIEADKFSLEFTRIAEGSAPRLRGRNLAIFAETAEWYPREDPYTGERLRLWAPTVRRTLGNIRRRMFPGRTSRRWFFERTIVKRRVVDELLVKDERLAQWHGAPVVWMPEISRPLLEPESAGSLAATHRTRGAVEQFLARNGGREPILYFGDAAYYKGYDLFLAYAAAHPDLCAFHAGRCHDPIEATRFTHDAQALRQVLLREGRLFELDAYVSTQSMKDLFFRAVRVYVTTHRLALSSSTMIQAAEFGRPVVVPDRGLLAHRVRTHGLGETYRYEDLSDLDRVARCMWSQDLNVYEPHLATFYRQFSDDAIRSFWQARLLGA